MSTEEKKSNLFHKNLEAYGIPPMLRKAKESPFGDPIQTNGGTYFPQNPKWTPGGYVSQDALAKIQLELEGVHSNITPERLKEINAKLEEMLASGKVWGSDANQSQERLAELKDESARLRAELDGLIGTLLMVGLTSEEMGKLFTLAADRFDLYIDEKGNPEGLRDKNTGELFHCRQPDPIDPETFIARLKAKIQSLESENSQFVKAVESQSKIIQALESKVERLRRGKP